MSEKKIKIKGVRRAELDYDAVSYVLFITAKREVEQRRRRAAEERQRKTQGGRR